MKILDIVKDRASVVLALIILIPLFTFSQQYYSNSGLRKLQATLQIINYAYVDSVKENELVETAIVEMLQELDPHSIYISQRRSPACQ